MATKTEQTSSKSSNSGPAVQAFSDVEEIRQDLESLKNNVVELTRHLRDSGKNSAAMLSKRARKKLVALKDNGADKLVKVEKRVKDKPLQSLAIAFAAGMVANILLGRR